MDMGKHVNQMSKKNKIINFLSIICYMSSKYNPAIKHLFYNISGFGKNNINATHILLLIFVYFE